MVSQTTSSVDPAVAGRQGTPTQPRPFLEDVSQTTRAVFARQRPWAELLDRSAFRKPESFADALRRIRKNFSYFRVNYAMFMLVVIGLSLLWHPVSLIVLAILVAAWIYLYFGRSEPLVLCNRNFGDHEVMIIMGIVTIVALFFTNAALNLITALVLGVAVMGVHAAFRSPDDLFLDEEENARSGLLHFPTSTGGVQSARV